MDNKLIISGSPHIHTGKSVQKCMYRVLIALVPVVITSIYYFGIGALIVMATSVAACVATEFVIQKYLLHGKSTISNCSAILTGLLLALNLPSNLPIWIVVIGAVVAIGIGKMAFGGLGQNIFNPALVGRVFMLISFPAQMTSWPVPLADRLSYTDAITGATLLGQLKMHEVTADQVNVITLALGDMGGSMGEVASLAIVLGLVYLLATRTISWHIPVSIVATVVIMSVCIGSNPMVEILSGGLLFGTVYMATDYVTSPMTRRGMIIYGVMIGVITLVIRHWGAYPEGMSFAILIMNGVTPLLNKCIKPIGFGERVQTHG